jgi:DNA-binding SARP family transcriptional activator
MQSLRIYLFGIPRLENNGDTLDIRRRKALALLAYLAVTNRPHTREALATMLWPENDQSSALANLRRELSRLNLALGEGMLEIDRPYVVSTRGGNLADVCSNRIYRRSRLMVTP